MEPINVLLLSTLSEEAKDQIRAVSPNVKLSDASPLLEPAGATEAHPGKFTDERISDYDNRQFEMMLAEAEVIYGFWLPPNVVTRAPRLKWIQAMTAGVDLLLDEALVKSRVKLTSATGLHATPVGEVAVMLMLMCAKQTPLITMNKLERKWERFTPEILQGKTVAVLGLGNIGKNIARLAKAFDMTVLATRRSAREGERARNVDTLFPVNKLREYLPRCDFVVMVLPFTPATDKMFGADEFNSMKQTAFIINMGRGQTIDEDAMIYALETGQIAGAGLDAYAVEPLPPESKLWELPNAILSPHVSGQLTNYNTIATQIFCENLQRYIRGRRLINLVNKKKGY